MAGISTGAAKSGRKSVDQEVSMVPFIDLLIVTISFLLVTAVWTSMARIEATPRAPSEQGKVHSEEKAALRVKVNGDGLVSLQWQRGAKTDDVETVTIDKLGDAMQRAWMTGLAMGHAVEPKLGEPGTSAILAVPAAMPMGEIAAVMDAVRSARLKDGRSVFEITFATT